MHVATLCQLRECVSTGASPGFSRGGGQEFFFQIWEFACREAMRFARGVRGHAPPEKFFLNGAIWCVLVYILIRFCL